MTKRSANRKDAAGGRPGERTRSDKQAAEDARAYRVRFLPVNREDMRERGWDECDFVYVSGDAYVDHSSFGAAIICRLLEANHYKVGMIAQPDWRDSESVARAPASGVPRELGKHGFHGESLYGRQEAPPLGCLLSWG